MNFRDVMDINSLDKLMKKTLKQIIINFVPKIINFLILFSVFMYLYGLYGIERVIISLLIIISISLSRIGAAIENTKIK